MYLSEKDIYEGLLNEDENVFKALFYDEKFRTVVGIVRASIFKVRDFESVKAEIYNELYFFLFSSDKSILQEFDRADLNEEGSFLIWLARTIIHFFQEKRHNELKTEKRHMELLTKRMEEKGFIYDQPKDVISDPEADLENKEFMKKLEMIIGEMENPKNKYNNRHYAEIMRKELIDEDMFLSFESSNLSQEIERAKTVFWKLFTEMKKKGEI